MSHKVLYTFLAEGDDAAVTLTYLELQCQAQAIGARLQSLNARGERALLLYASERDFLAAWRSGSNGA